MIDDPDLSTIDKQTTNPGGLQEKGTVGRNEIAGDKSEFIDQSGVVSNADDEQYVTDARAAAAARLAALAAAKQLRDDGHRVEIADKTSDMEALPVETVDLKLPSIAHVALSLDTPENEDGIRAVHSGVSKDSSMPNRAGPGADYKEQFIVVRDGGQLVSSQQPPAQYNHVAATKEAQVAAPAFASPSPTPHILDEDEDGHWDPALTELLEKHRLMRLAPGLRALGESESAG